MFDFTYKCPKCRKNGKGSDFRCYNCGGWIDRVENGNYVNLQCGKCKIFQDFKCPAKCGAVITPECTKSGASLFLVIIGVIFLFAILND
jgi:phage FluMu protein Com